MQLTLEKLTDDKRRTILSRLIKHGVTEELGKEFDITIPSRITVRFHCPKCRNPFSNRLMACDIQNMRKYINCPDCKSKAFLENIGAPKEATRLSKGWSNHFDEET